MGEWLPKKLCPISSCQQLMMALNRGFLGEHGSNEGKMLLRKGVGAVWRRVRNQIHPDNLEKRVKIP